MKSIRSHSSWMRYLFLFSRVELGNREETPCAKGAPSPLSKGDKRNAAHSASDLLFLVSAFTQTPQTSLKCWGLSFMRSSSSCSL
jgi:hypothetical protein